MPRLLRSSLERWIDPAVAFLALFGDETDVVWLDSGPDAGHGRSYLGRASRVVTSQMVGSVLEFLRDDLAARALPPTGEGFALGWVGWIGYETRFETQGITRTRTSDYPDAAFLFIDRAIEFDHASGEITLLGLGDDWTGELGDWRREVEATLVGPSRASGTAAPEVLDGRGVPEVLDGRGVREVLDGSGVASVPEALEGPVARWRDTGDDYLEKVRACQAAIAAGDAYLLCLTTEVTVDVTPDPVATYLALRASSPTHHGALLRIRDIALLSASPELFLTVSPDGTIESRPIKGTRARGGDAESDAALAAELSASEKERAENLMIVDLMRNDIGRVSRIGSVEVPGLLEIESYAHVHQLVSAIRGELAPGLTGMDAVVACFPAGSMTGTPKSSATRILDSLEAAPRGIYSGAFGYFGLDGRIDLAMVIRSIVLSPAGATIGAGGGITALSDPAEELAEVGLKAAALLRVLGVRPVSD